MAFKETVNLIGGIGLLLTGQKVPALGVFGRGILELERQWRERHPDVTTDWDTRWQASIDFYDHTHVNDINRMLHMAGMPMIVGGALGLLLGGPFRPFWLGSALSFGLGLTLNVIGHTFFEKSSHRFTEDPLAAFAGPFFDLQCTFGGKTADRQNGEHPDDELKQDMLQQAILN